MSNSKLDTAVVKAIFARKGEKQAAVAADHHVSQTTVSSIWLGKIWRGVTGMPRYLPSRQRHGMPRRDVVYTP